MHTVKEGNAFYEIDEDCMEMQRQSGVKIRERGGRFFSYAIGGAWPLKCFPGAVLCENGQE